MEIYTQIEQLKTTGKIFSLLFVRKRDKKERLMICRGGVTSYLTDTSEPELYEEKRKEKGIITVFDMQKQAYRCIDVNTILEINARAVMILQDWLTVEIFNLNENYES